VARGKHAGYFQRLENCRHRRFDRFLSKLGINPSRHAGEGGCQPSRDPSGDIHDKDLRSTIVESARDALNAIGRPRGDRARLDSQADPNDWRTVEESAVGVRYAPLTTDNHARVGTRERFWMSSAGTPTG